MDLSQRDVEASMDSRESIKELLDAAAAISRPGEGAPRVLLVFAQMAAGACDWLDGELRVELVEADGVTVIECMTDLGGGFRERVFPPIVMKAPIEEFRRATTVPEMITPLVLKSSRGRRLVLVGAPQAEAPSMMAPAVQIGHENLFDPATSPKKKPTPPPRTMSSHNMRAVKRVAVPAPAPLPTFVDDPFDAGTAESEMAPPPETIRGSRTATEAPVTEAPVTEQPVTTRTMIPGGGGHGAPPPPPIVTSKIRTSRPAPGSRPPRTRRRPS